VVRAEHAGHLFVERERTFELMHSGRVMPMTNPAFIYNIGSALPRYIGPPAIGNRFVFRSMLEAGFRITGSSDIHVGAHPAQTNPLFMMERSCGRLGFDGSQVDPDEALDVMTALRMHTLYAAEALGVADRRGTLEAGKVADVIVLDRDPRTVPADQLSTVKVDYVFMDGRVVYSRPGAVPPRETAPSA
jgi:predicted amidohydrolase YtcJ